MFFKNFGFLAGVSSSASISHCLRYAIELARLQVLRLVTTDIQYAQQTFISNAWKAKCLAQLDLVGMCAVTKALDVVGGTWSTGPPNCAFQWKNNNEQTYMLFNAYITPGCLVYLMDTHEAHDPCKFYDCAASANGGERIQVQVSDFLQANVRVKTLVAYNPMQLVNVYRDMHAGAKWSTATTNTTFLQKMSEWYSSLKAISPRLQASFLKDVVQGQILEDDVLESDCGMMQDWWPEQFEYPVGYHPTVPCMSSDTAHRTYDQVFAYDEDANEMVYMPLEMRDARMVHNYFGVEGICRASNYDIDMAEVNTARTCTRQRLDPTHDPTVPKPSSTNMEDNKPWASEYCAPSSGDVPWSLEDYATDIGMIGKGILSTGTIVLDHGERGRSLRLWNTHIVNGNDLFGDQCTHARLPDPCTSDAQCATGYRCHGIGKVCVKVDVAKCYVHADCQQDQYMCSGDGTCVQPAISVRNELGTNESIEFRMYSAACPQGERVDMYGLSPWERVPDFLYAHGLCSYRNWYEYNRTLSSAASSSTCSATTDNVCTLDADDDSWFFTSDADRAVIKGLQRQRVLYQQAHVCDRDYMHADGMTSCMASPSQIYWKRDGAAQITTPNANNVQDTYLKRPAWLRFYTADNFLRLASISRSSSNSNGPKYGFLGRPSSGVFNTYSDFNFKRCSTLMQCFQQDFFLYGYQVTRKVRREVGNVLGNDYAFGEEFDCGGFGYKSSDEQTERCKLDLAVATMYRVLCYSQTSREAVVNACKQNLMKVTDASTLANEFCAFSIPGSSSSFTPNGYIPTWNVGLKEGELQSIANSLNRLASSTLLWQPFNTQPTSEAYMRGVECANVLYAQVKQTAQEVAPLYILEKTTTSDGREVPTKSAYGGMSLYHFSKIGMYEYPLSWFYKCGLQSEGRFASSSTPVYCDAWSNRLHHTSVSPVGLDTWTYLKRLDGGLAYSAFASMLASSITAWFDLVDTTYDGIPQSVYFNTEGSNAGSKYVRMCANRREISRFFVATSATLGDELKRELTSSVSTAMGSTTWPAEFASHDKCIGSFPNKLLVNGKPSCTVGLEKRPKSGSGDITELRAKVLAYFKLSPIRVYDFILENSMMTGSLKTPNVPVLEYLNIALNTSDNTMAIQESRISRMTDTAPDANCAVQRFDTVSQDMRECFLDKDDTIALFEQANPQYKELKSKKPYVIAAWGMNNPYTSGTWPMVKSLYDGLHPIAGESIIDSAIFTQADVPIGPAGAKFQMPDLAVGVMDVTVPGWKLGDDPEYGVPTSFCSLYEHTPDTPNFRDDPCTSSFQFPNANLGLKMGATDNTCPNVVRPNVYTSVSARDFNNGQTCIAQSMCMWKNSPRKLISSPNWYFDFFRDNVKDYKGIQEDTYFHAQDIWRWHIDPRHITEFYLPVGVFLQTFRPQLIEADCKYCPYPTECSVEGRLRCNWNDGRVQTIVNQITTERATDWDNPFLFGRQATPVLWFQQSTSSMAWESMRQDGGPQRTFFMNQFDFKADKGFGMWPMCPHANQGFMEISAADAYKSMLLQADDVINKRFLYKPTDKEFKIPEWIPRNPWSCVLGACDKFLRGDLYWINSTILQTLPMHPTIPFRSSAWMNNVKTCGHSDVGIKKCTIEDGYATFRIGLAPGYVINPSKCGKLQYAYPVMGNIKRCLDCKWWTPRYCSGQHECRFPLVSGEGRITAWQQLQYVSAFIKSKIKEGDESANVLEFPASLLSGSNNNNKEGVAPVWTRGYLEDETAIKAMIALTGHFLLEKNGGTNKRYMNIAPMPLYMEESSNWKSSNPFQTYDPSPMLTYEEQLPVLADPQTEPNNKRCSGKKLNVKDGNRNQTVYKINYKACNFSSNYQRLIDVVGNQSSTSSSLRVPEGIILPWSARLAYFTSKSIMIANGIPAWSRSTRPSNDIFVQNLLNATAQCSYGNIRESICSLNNDNLYNINPW